MKEIIQVNQDFIREFFYPLPHTILYDKNARYYSLIVNHSPVCMAGIKGNRIKCCYTPKQYRKNGYFSILLTFLLDNGSYFEALCTKDSRNIFEKAGFKIVKQYDKQNKKGEQYTLWLCRYRG